MSAVGLRIEQPAHGAVLVGQATVDLAGRVVELPPELAGTTLYYRWYSSLFPARKDRYSINPTALTGLAAAFAAPLGVGSQAITLAAGDQPGEDEAAQAATRHGGITGGAPDQCVVHVLRAARRAPVPGATLSKQASTLDAGGPLHWSSAAYQALNRVRYRWSFRPSPPDGRAEADLVPAPADLHYVDANTNPALDPDPLVRYQGPLPAALGLGGYTLGLRVEDGIDATVGHDAAAIPVVIAP